MAEEKCITCGKPVRYEKEIPVSTIYKNKRYIFCGAHCKELFDKEPQKYAKPKQ